MGFLKRLLRSSVAEESRRRRLQSSVDQSGEEVRAKVKRAEALRKAGLEKEASALEDEAMKIAKSRTVQMQVLASMGLLREDK